MSALGLRGYGPEWLKQTYLLGVDLTLDDGSPYPDELFTTALDQSERAIASELGLTLQPQTYQERHDREPDGVSGWWPIRSRQRPLLAVDKLSIVYGRSTTRSELPPEWAIITEQDAGQIHIVPTTEGASSYLVAGGMPVILGLGGLSQAFYVPAYFELTYQAGFPLYTGAATIAQGQSSTSISLPATLERPYTATTSAGSISARLYDSIEISLDSPAQADTPLTWQVDTMPPELIRAIALKSSNVVLNIAGDLIAGAGIAQLSTSMDGLSQSIATTASATNAGYGARILQYERELKELMGTLKATYRALNFAAL
jgi:hypothetical protein